MYLSRDLDGLVAIVDSDVVNFEVVVVDVVVVAEKVKSSCFYEKIHVQASIQHYKYCRVLK